MNKDTLQKVHENIVKENNSDSYFPATVTCTIDLAGGGGHLHGWITYNDETLGKKYFESIKVHQHFGMFAGGGALDFFAVLTPAAIKNAGSFEASGSCGGGVLMLFNDAGEKVFKIQFPVGGIGTPYWSIKGDLRFE